MTCRRSAAASKLPSSTTAANAASCGPSSCGSTISGVDHLRSVALHINNANVNEELLAILTHTNCLVSIA
ncbi:Uncharacterised protein [Mycobacterium tuberculosis]|nr:Uncharacterised protein [Mycobacterium tuberculosis]